jgi:F420-dependent oxidoreductase-like protein
MSKRNLTRRSFLAGAVVAASSVAFGEAAREQEPTSEEHPETKPGEVRFGVTSHQGWAFDEIAEFWREAESLGYDTAFVYDHFMSIGKDPCCLEAWTLLAALAAQTQRIRVGTLVTGNTYRSPVIVAKMAATVDQISGGRLILGLGAGWLRSEHESFGFRYGTAGERARRLVESVEVIKMLFTRESSTFDGKYYSLQNAPFEPRPIQKPHPPILIGGMGPKIVQPLAARHAQIWHLVAPRNDPEEVRRLVQHFDSLCDAEGRNPDDVEKAISLSPKQLRSESIATARQQVLDLVGAGIRHFILLPPAADGERDAIRRFAREVVPELRPS